MNTRTAVDPDLVQVLESPTASLPGIGVWRAAADVESDEPCAGGSGLDCPYCSGPETD